MTGPGAERAQVARRAVAAAVAVAREHGVAATGPVVLHDLFSLRVHLRPAPVVARVPTWITRLRAGTDWIAREVDVATHLAGAGVPVVPPSAELPPGPHHRNGFAVTFWTYARPALDRPVDAATCAAMLPELHAGLDTYPGALPDLVPGTVDLPRWLAALDTAPDLEPGEVELLHDIASRLRPLLHDAAGQYRPLHGDVHPGNLIGTADGPLWTDLEEVCRGPLEWDLATIDDPAAVDLVWRAVAATRDAPGGRLVAGSLTPHDRPDPALLAACTRLRYLQIALCLAQLRAPFAGVPGWEEGLRGALDALHAVAGVP